MQATLRGFRKLDFVSDKNENIQGIQLFVSFTDSSVSGEMTEKLFIRPEVAIPEGIKPGDKLNLYFNHKGKVEAIQKG
jgi:hypothetical protein